MKLLSTAIFMLIFINMAFTQNAVRFGVEPYLTPDNIGNYEYEMSIEELNNIGEISLNKKGYKIISFNISLANPCIEVVSKCNSEKFNLQEYDILKHINSDTKYLYFSKIKIENEIGETAYLSSIRIKIKS